MAQALAAPQTGPSAGKPPQSLMAGANRLFVRLAGGFSSRVGGNAGVHLIGATFVL